MGFPALRSHAHAEPWAWHPICHWTLPMRFFLAGIMQGSHLGFVLHNQDYRGRLKQLLAEHFPGADIYDPLADHANSLDYDEQKGREVFWHHNRLCREVDVVIAFVPEASM